MMATHLATSMALALVYFSCFSATGAAHSGTTQAILIREPSLIGLHSDQAAEFGE
jgi:hypothetical protein